MERRDATGKRGEAIFFQEIMNFCGRDLPYFNPIFLGEKNESLDYLVELVGNTAVTPFFFVQVKATKLGLTSARPVPRLKVKVPTEAVAKIRHYPAPTYLVGVDEPNGCSFIVAIDETVRGGISSIPTTYPLNCQNLARLWDEVHDSWHGRDMTMRTSAFAI